MTSKRNTKLKKSKKSRKTKKGGAYLNNSQHKDSKILYKIIKDFKIQSRPINIKNLSKKVSGNMLELIKSLGEINEETIILTSDKVIKFELELKLKEFVVPFIHFATKPPIFYDSAQSVTSRFAHLRVLNKYDTFPILMKRRISNQYVASDIEEHAGIVLPYFKCYDLIIIPLALYIFDGSSLSHMVSLIFRKSETKFEFELYDPNGFCYESNDYTSFIVKYINELIVYIKTTYSIFIEFSQSEVKRGFQSIQEKQQRIHPLNYNYVPEGFCSMWNPFMWELIIQNPTIKLDDIIRALISEFMINLNKIIVGYVLYVQNELNSFLLSYDTDFETLFPTKQVSGSQVKSNMTKIAQIIKDLDLKINVTPKCVVSD